MATWVMAVQGALGWCPWCHMAVHEGGITGPEVMGSWMLHEDGIVMRFMPDSALMAGMGHAIQLGGGLEDAKGHPVDLETHGTHMGGMWATDSMMHGGMMHGGHDHMGGGWEHPENGSHGMVFPFVTSGR